MRINKNSLDHEELVGNVEVEFRAEFLESDEMGVKPAAADLVAARLGDVSHAEARQHRADQHDRTPQAGAALAVVVRLEVFEVDVSGAEGIGILRELFDDDAHAPQQFDELHDIENPGNVPHDDPLGGQQRGAEYLQSFVLGALGRDRSVETVSAFDFEYGHKLSIVTSPKVVKSREDAKQNCGRSGKTFRLSKSAVTAPKFVRFRAFCPAFRNIFVKNFCG